MTETVVADLGRVARTDGQGGDLHRQRPCRLGGGDRQHPRARAEGAGARHRALRARLGADGAADGRRRRGDGLRLPRRDRRRRGSPSGSAPTAGTRSARCWRCRPTPPPRCGTTCAALRAALDAAGHPALLVIDCIACLACDRFEMDAWGVDVMVAACQKGLMTPPGAGLHLPRAAGGGGAGALREPLLGLGAADGAERPLPALLRHGADAPPLRAALRPRHDPRRGGARGGLGRHAVFARAVWAAVEAWGAGGRAARSTSPTRRCAAMR